MISLCWTQPSCIWSLGVHHTWSERVEHPLWEAGRVADGHQSWEERRRTMGCVLRDYGRLRGRVVSKKTGTGERRWVFPHLLWSLVSPQSRNQFKCLCFSVGCWSEVKHVYLTQKMSWCNPTYQLRYDIQMTFSSCGRPEMHRIIGYSPPKNDV